MDINIEDTNSENVSSNITNPFFDFFFLLNLQIVSKALNALLCVILNAQSGRLQGMPNNVHIQYIAKLSLVIFGGQNIFV